MDRIVLPLVVSVDTAVHDGEREGRRKRRPEKRRPEKRRMEKRWMEKRWRGE